MRISLRKWRPGPKGGTKKRPKVDPKLDPLWGAQMLRNTRNSKGFGDFWPLRGVQLWTHFRSHFVYKATIKTWKVLKFEGPGIDPKMCSEMSPKLDPSERSKSSKTLWIPCVSEHLGSPKGVRFWVPFWVPFPDHCLAPASISLRESFTTYLYVNLGF